MLYWINSTDAGCTKHFSLSLFGACAGGQCYPHFVPPSPSPRDKFPASCARIGTTLARPCLRFHAGGAIERSLLKYIPPPLNPRLDSSLILISFEELRSASTGCQQVTLIKGRLSRPTKPEEILRACGGFQPPSARGEFSHVVSRPVMHHFRRKPSNPPPVTPKNNLPSTSTSPIEYINKEIVRRYSRAKDPKALAASSSAIALSIASPSRDVSDAVPDEPESSKEPSWRTAYGAARMAVEIAKESSDMFLPLKAVVGALAVLIKNYDVRYIRLSRLIDR